MHYEQRHQLCVCLKDETPWPVPLPPGRSSSLPWPCDMTPLCARSHRCCPTALAGRSQQGVWLAQDRKTREIVGCHIGARDEAGAIALWQSLPDCYLNAETYTDYWNAYRAIFYANTLYQVGKESGQTNHIERFNNTLRQRVSRLVRKTLSFSKNLANHIGAVWFFIHHYSTSLLL